MKKMSKMTEKEALVKYLSDLGHSNEEAAAALKKLFEYGDRDFERFIDSDFFEAAIYERLNAAIFGLTRDAFRRGWTAGFFLNTSEDLPGVWQEEEEEKQEET